MPITAVLSRTLHDALGDEAAADLVEWMQHVDTQRSELRELNELSFARIDSRFKENDARFDAARHEMLTEVGKLRMEMHDGFADAKLGLALTESKMDRRFAELDSKIDRKHAELLKWSFVFWCGAFATTALALWSRR
jgi:hypothetical protein